MADLFTARLAAHGSPHTAIITIHEKRRGTTVHNDTHPPPRENNFISSLSLCASSSGLPFCRATPGTRSRLSARARSIRQWRTCDQPVPSIRKWSELAPADQIETGGRWREGWGREGR